MQNVALIARHFNPDRYSFLAFRLLQEFGHTVFPVAPDINELEGIKVFRSVLDIPVPIQSVSLYINPYWLKAIIREIISIKPGRVIFNPGTESPECEQMLKENNIHNLKACTLVLLKTGQFE